MRNPLRKHLNAVVEQVSRQGTLTDTRWQFLVWLHQNQAGVSLFSKGFPVFSTTWKVDTGWRIYHGERTVHWIPSPEDAVEVARVFRSEGWRHVFICSTRLGLTGPSHHVPGNLDDPIAFSRLVLDLEREQNERPAVSLAANGFSNLVHLLFGAPVGIVRALIQVVRFGMSREHPSWLEFWAILAWRVSGKPSAKDRLATPATPANERGFSESVREWLRATSPSEKHTEGADYSYEVYVCRHGKVIAITDHCPPGRISVTNDAENVITELAEKGFDLSQYRMLFKDALGVWNEMRVKDGRLDGFFIIHEPELYTALAKLELN